MFAHAHYCAVSVFASASVLAPALVLAATADSWSACAFASAPLSTSARGMSQTTPRLLLNMLPLLFLIMLLLLLLAGVGWLQLRGTSPLLSRQARK